MNSFGVLVNLQRINFGGTQGSSNEQLQVVGVIDHINIFISKLSHNTVNPRPFHSNACPNWINAVIIGIHSHFGFFSGNSDGFLNGDKTIKNLRD